MAMMTPNLQATDCSNLIPSLTSLFPPRLLHRPLSLPHSRFISKASLHHPSSPSSSSSPPSLVNRRQLISQTASLSLSLATLSSLPLPAKSEEVLSEWERVYLPIDPGVVLLDIAFVPDDLNHGFLLGTRQTILETKDGGNTWTQRSIPSAEDEDFNYRFNSISFKGKEGWIVGKPAILLYTSDAGESWERIPLSAQLPGDMVYIKATGEKSAEMVTDQGAIYVTSNRGYNWRAAVQETVSATLNRTVSSGISGASYYTGTFNTVNRSPDGRYVAVSSRGNFYLTWEPGQPFWQPHNRAIARRIQNMGWRADGGLWLLVRGGGLFLSKGTGISEDFEEVPVQSRGFGILDVGYRSEEEAWAAGGSGILLRTTNGGKNWTRDKAADNIAANLYSVKFINDKKGFVLGNDGVLLRCPTMLAILYS
ncbi:photosystem II stability/assembly factor HCF136, chloroplastic [Gossypium australe]|uniref:Photosystem II stability/assembly factor HCF136, chloroplastic n=1 Tax=Gossypium australe TaxID=47621 RepID=A0A5B6WMZ1_9ROSI|nr:photosystem II stability/assembly factor HCF136, chloroplastic [Gossypium australe]